MWIILEPDKETWFPETFWSFDSYIFWGRGSKLHCKTCFGISGLAVGGNSLGKNKRSAFKEEGG